MARVSIHGGRVRSILRGSNLRWHPDCYVMTSPVKLSRERWETLRASWEYPIIGMYSDGSRFINVLEPREVSGITFLPATYVPEISAGEQSAIRAHEYLYGPTRLLGSA